jgi:uncharacterized protein YkwD
MLWATIGVLAAVLLGGNPPEKARPVKVSMASPDARADQSEPPITFEADAEQRLIELTNAERARRGQPPLAADEGLTAAARAHAALMAEQGTLSHQFPGEAPLLQRLTPSSLQFDQVGENVALDVDIDRAHQGLMRSPHHRENILRPSYNVAGFGVARDGDRIYVVEDFGRSLPTVSAGEAENAVAAAITQARGDENRPQLQRLQLGGLRNSACKMASQDHLNPKAVSGLGALRYVLAYTNMTPGTLPATADKAIDDNGLRSFAVGACFARSSSYPNGAYWVTLVFY